MLSTGIKRAFDEGLQAAIPDGALTISKWAETYRYVERSAFPGKWSNERFPFLTEIMDAINDPQIVEVVFMKSSQVGGSELAVNMIGYFIHMDPTYIMYLAEQEEKAKAWTSESFDTTIASTDVLRNLVRLDSSDNNQRIKRFPGGQLTIAWASSPAQLSSRPIRVLICDEIDAYIVTKEGDAIKLAEARQKTFSETRKILKISSPRDKDTSLIEPAYLGGDQREFFVPCPQCNEFQTLRWANMKWAPGESDLAYMLCEHNGCVIEHDEKADMLSKGRWIPGAETRHIASFKINEIYSPVTSWAGIVNDFLVAKNHADTLRVWTNTRMGETWKLEETIDYLELVIHQENYGGVEVPDGVLMLTAGIDVQGDRLEMEVVGWGRNRENWSIDYQIFEGSPSLPGVWSDLFDALTRNYTASGGRVFTISSAAIDSGSYTTDVYAFCKEHKGRRWFAVKGTSAPGNPLVKRGSLSRRERVRIWMVGTSTAKDEIFSFLRVPDAGSPGYCHYPNDEERYGDQYKKQLCSERRMPKTRMGVTYYIYEKVAASVRNEALDCRVYASAARAIVVKDFDKWANREWKRQQRRLADPENAPETDAPVLPDTTDRAEEIEQKKPEITKDATPLRKKGRRIINRNEFKGYKV